MKAPTARSALFCFGMLPLPTSPYKGAEPIQRSSQP